MFQDVLTEHVSKLVPFVAPTFVQSGVAHFRNVAAPTSLEAYQVGAISGTGTAGQFLSFGVMVADPELRGPMVLSYEFSFGAFGGAPTLILPMAVDVQSASALAANTITPLAAAVDVAWNLPPVVPVVFGGSTSFGLRGRSLVNTSITSATPGITVRQFGVGACVRIPAGAQEFWFSAQVRLFSQQEQFFQPGK